MSRLYEIAKRVVFHVTPGPVLTVLKRRRYRHVVENFDEREEPDMQVVRALVAEGDTACDVGANIGVYTKLLSELVGQTGSVISFEPVPETFSYLASNVRALGLSRVHLVNAAASDGSGSRSMTIPTFSTGGLNHYEASITKTEDDSSLHVRAVKLDDALSGAGRIAMMKIDVEGHESACLDGAWGILVAHHPSLLVEVSGNPDDPSSATAALFSKLSQLGYGTWLYDGAHLRPRASGDRSTNYFFLTDDHVARVARNAPTVLGAASH